MFFLSPFLSQLYDTLIQTIERVASHISKFEDTYFEIFYTDEEYNQNDMN